MIKKLIVSACLLLSFAGFSQEGSSSPYSLYGIGESRFKGTAENRSMGGLMIFTDSIHMNIQNPASYSNLKLTSFSVGGSYATTRMNTETQTSDATRVTLDYFAVGLPFKKFGVGFGLMPLTSVGYKIQSNVSQEAVLTQKRATGKGGINKAFLAAAYQVTPKFSLGAEFGYNFGKIETSSVQRAEGVQLGSRELNTSYIAGASFLAGANYKTKVNSKLDFYSALTYAFEGKLNSDNERQIATIQFLPLGGEAVSGTPIDVDVASSSLTMPSKLTFGAGVGQDRKWSFGAEVAMQDTRSQTNRFADISNDRVKVTFENSMKYAIGGFYIPKYSSYSNYISRITYRAGMRFENTGLVINNKAIEDAAVTIGFGLPISTGTFSNINLGFEYGKRGTIYSGLIEENYANVYIGLSFNDKWFVKRKYD